MTHSPQVENIQFFPDYQPVPVYIRRFPTYGQDFEGETNQIGSRILASIGIGYGEPVDLSRTLTRFTGTNQETEAVQVLQAGYQEAEESLDNDPLYQAVRPLFDAAVEAASQAEAKSYWGSRRLSANLAAVQPREGPPKTELLIPHSTLGAIGSQIMKLGGEREGFEPEIRAGLEVVAAKLLVVKALAGNQTLNQLQDWEIATLEDENRQLAHFPVGADYEVRTRQRDLVIAAAPSTY